MTRRCILQIGTEKTGTTTLQAFLASNRSALRRRGVVYPRFPGDRNHTSLAAYAMDDARHDPIREALAIGRPADLPAFRAGLEAAAQAELASPGTVIFCNEHCHSRLRTREEVQRLADLISPHFDRIDVSVYLRRQDQVALSLYSTRLKSGATDTDILPRTDPQDPFFNYDLSLALWEEVFGRPHVHVRLFDRNELAGGDVVRDFLGAWGLGTPDEYHAVARKNESISAEAQDYLRRINASVKPLPGLPLDAVLGPLSFALARHFPGSGARPPRAQALAFYDMFRASNEAVRRRHFPGRSALFDEDFDGYPEEGDRLDFGPDAFAAIAACLHTANMRHLLRLEAELQIREGRLAWESGDAEAAIAALRRAVALLPDHPDSHRALAEYLVRADRHTDAAVPARKAAELRPRQQEYWHFLGMVLRNAGELDAAAEAQARSLELDPDHAPSLRSLDSIRAELARGRGPADDTPQARQSHDPDHPTP